MLPLFPSRRLRSLALPTVNRAEPMNLGLVYWGQQFALGRQGVQFPDLLGLAHGTLTNGAYYNNSLRAPMQGPGVTFDGTDDYIGLTPVGWPAVDAAKSLLCWFTYDGTATRRILCSGVKDDSSTANNSYNLEVNSRTSLAVVRWGAWGGLIWGQLAIDQFTANTVICCLICQPNPTAATLRGFLNGQEVTVLDNASRSQSGAIAVARVGSFNNAFPSPYHNRDVYSVQVWNRDMSDYAPALYSDALQGSPRRLLQGLRAMAALPAAGGSSVPRFYHQRQQQGMAS